MTSDVDFRRDRRSSLSRPTCWGPCYMLTPTTHQGGDTQRHTSSVWCQHTSCHVVCWRITSVMLRRLDVWPPCFIKYIQYMTSSLYLYPLFQLCVAIDTQYFAFFPHAWPRLFFEDSDHVGQYWNCYFSFHTIKALLGRNPPLKVMFGFWYISSTIHYIIM